MKGEVERSGNRGTELEKIRKWKIQKKRNKEREMNCILESIGKYGNYRSEFILSGCGSLESCERQRSDTVHSTAHRNMSYESAGSREYECREIFERVKEKDAADLPADLRVNWDGHPIFRYTSDNSWHKNRWS